MTTRVALLSLVTAASFVGAYAADEMTHPICSLVIHDERRELEVLRLAIALSETRLAAAEEIHTLLDKLWKKNAVARLGYLEAMHDRDVARLRKERAILRLERQEGVIGQYEAVCSSPTGGASRQRDRTREAYEAYGRVHCGVLDKNAAIADADLIYDKELLASVLDLRANNVATEQAVIRARRDVEMDHQRIESMRRQAEACRQEFDAGTAE